MNTGQGFPKYSLLNLEKTVSFDYVICAFSINFLQMRSWTRLIAVHRHGLHKQVISKDRAPWRLRPYLVDDIHKRFKRVVR